MKVKINIINMWCTLMSQSEAVTMPSLTQMTSTVFEESRARTDTHTDTRSRFCINICKEKEKGSLHDLPNCVNWIALNDFIHFQQLIAFILKRIMKTVLSNGDPYIWALCKLYHWTPLVRVHMCLCVSATMHTQLTFLARQYSLSVTSANTQQCTHN